MYFSLKPADLRRSFDGLAALASSELARDPSRGGRFVFTNRRGNQVRILFRDPRGWCVLAKRLDPGRFRRPSCEEDRVVWEVHKHVDGLPLHRIQRMFSRAGVDLAVQTLNRWELFGQQLAAPIARRIRDLVLACDTINLDDTGLRVRDATSEHEPGADTSGCLSGEPSIPMAT